MSNKLIERLFAKRGITDANKLSPEEKQTFDNWEQVLNKDELTMEDLKHFLEGQIGVIEKRWQDLTLENAKKVELLPYHTNYKILLQAINAPKDIRSALEQQLNQLLNN